MFLFQKLCDYLHRFFRETQLTEALAKGDYLEIGFAGSVGFKDIYHPWSKAKIEEVGDNIFRFTFIDNFQGGLKKLCSQLKTNCVILKLSKGWTDLAPYTPIGTLTFVGTESHAPAISFSQFCQEELNTYNLYF